MAALAFNACQKESGAPAPESEGVVVNVLASDVSTKTTVVDGSTPTVKWLDTDAIRFFEVVDGAVYSPAEGTVSSETTLLESGAKASFKVSLTGTPSGTSFMYSAVYPESAVSKAGSGFYRLLIPAAQHLTGTNLSADSDLLISTVYDNGASRVTADQSILLSFRRVGTLVRLNLKGVTPGELIQRVEITAPKNIAGRVKYSPVSGNLDSTSWHYDNSTNSKTITLTVDDVVATGDDFVWFRVLAAESWAVDEQLSVVVETDQAYYRRDGSDGEHAKITLGSEMQFPDGGLTRFGVNLGAYRIVKAPAVNYTLVEDQASIADGAQYLIVSGTRTMGAFNSTYFTYVDVTVNGKVISITSNDVQVITLEDASDGKFFLKDGEGNYISSTANKSLSIGEKVDNDAHKWTVTPSEIASVGVEGGKILYNSSSPRFTCYTSAQQAVSLYVNSATLLPLGISFSTAAYNFELGSSEFDAFAGQAVTKADGASDERTVTYSKNDDSGVISTLNTATGAVTLSGNAGTATVSASVPADATHRAGSASYTVTVLDNRPAVATPTFSPSAGEVELNTNVTISCATDGAAIHYTVDGSTPTTSSATYTAPVAITTAMTIKAIAVKDSYKNSEVATASYTIAPEASTVAQVLAGGAGSYKINNLLVYNVNGKNAIVGDNTGKMLLFMNNSLTAGDNINIASAVTTVYNGILEITGGNITTNSSGNAVDHGTAVNLNDADVASATHTAFSAAGYHSAVYVSMTGTQSEGKYITGSNPNTKLYMNGFDAANNGKTVNVTGYIYSWNSSYSNYNFLAVSLEVDNTVPTISVSPASLSWAAAETDAKNLTVTLNGSAAAGDYTYNVTSGTAADWTISKNNGTLSVAPNAANADTENAKSITIRIAHVSDNTVYQDVICTQAKASSGNTPNPVDKEYSFAFSTISAGISSSPYCVPISS